MDIKKIVKKNLIIILRLLIATLLLLVGYALEKASVLQNKSLLAIYLSAYILLSFTIIWRAVANTLNAHLFDENFLITLLSFYLIAIGEVGFAILLVLLFITVEFISDLNFSYCKNKIMKVKNFQVDNANLIVDKIPKKVNVEELEVGDLILVYENESVPIDGIIESGSGVVQYGRISGNNNTQKVNKNDKVYEGCFLESGEIIVKVVKPHSESCLQNLVKLADMYSKVKIKKESTLGQFSRWFSILILCISIFIAFIVPLFYGAPIKDWATKSIRFTAMLCPYAIIFVVPIIYVYGIKYLYKYNILLKGATTLSLLKRVNKISFNVSNNAKKEDLEITKILSFGILEKEVLKIATITLKNSSHPFRATIIKANGDSIENTAKQTDEFNNEKGITINDTDGLFCVGSRQYFEDNDIEIPVQLDTDGLSLLVAKNKVLVGCIFLDNKINYDVNEAISDLKQCCITNLNMKTNKNIDIAMEVGKVVDENMIIAYDEIRLNRKKLKIVNRKRKNYNDKKLDILLSTKDIEIKDIDLLKIKKACNVSKVIKRYVNIAIILILLIKLILIFAVVMNKLSTLILPLVDIGIIAITIIIIAILSIFEQKLKKVKPIEY